MKPKVYLESSLVSYLTSKPSRDFVSNYREQLQINEPEIRETLGERLEETLARRYEDSDIKLV